MPDDTFAVLEESDGQTSWVCYTCNRIWDLEIKACLICNASAVKCQMCKCITSEEECGEVSLLDEKGHVAVGYDRLCDACVQSLKNMFDYVEVKEDGTSIDEEDII